MLLEKISEELYWVIIAILALNLFQRKHQPRSSRKRSTTVIIAVLVLLLNIQFVIILGQGLPHWTAFIAAAITIGVGWLLRKKMATFRRTCPACSARLTLNDIFFFDDNLCATCHREQFPDLYAAAEPEPEPEELPEPSKARDTADIDWDEWEPRETAVICYVFHGDEVMLIHKKTGLGSGMVNAPGGRIEPDETAIEAAVRETEEETGITPVDPVPVGILNFQFVDGYSIRGYVFFAWNHTGELTETREADPFWASVDRIPYDRMWEDDRHWLPLALGGSYVVGNFIFDDRTMLSMDITTSERKSES